MSVNNLSRKVNKTHKKLASDWRHAVPKFQLEINDQAWPELPKLSTQKLTVDHKTRSDELCRIINKDDASEDYQSFIINPAHTSDTSGTADDSCVCECDVTQNKHGSHIGIVINEVCIEQSCSKNRNNFVAEVDKSNSFCARQEKKEQFFSYKSYIKNSQKIVDTDINSDSKHHGHKKTDKNVTSFHENNFQNDFLVDFPTLDVNKKKMNSKLKQLHMHCGESSKHSLDNNTKKPKAKDPICINIFDVISTLPVKPKLSRGKFEANILLNPSVTVIKPFRKRVNVEAHTYGNPLDSDKPLRKRGKVRPNKKCKPSLIKAIILKTREEKIKAKDAAKKQLTDSKTIALNDGALSVYDRSLKDKDINGEKGDNCCKYTVIQNDEKITIPRLLHTRKFREYCNNCLTTELVQSASLLVETVVRYQDRLYSRDPIKAHAKRRYVVGLREANKYSKMKRVKLLIIAPDLEYIPGKGGLDDTIQQLKEDAEIQHIPYLFGPSRKQLGKSSRKNVLVSCIAVLNYEGAEGLVSKVLQHLFEARKKYSAILCVCGHDDIASIRNKTDTVKEDNVDTKVIVSLLQKLTCGDSNICQESTKDEGKHTTSSPFLAALENIL